MTEQRSQWDRAEWIQSQPAHLVLLSSANARQTTGTNKITLSTNLLNQEPLQNNSCNLVRSEKSIKVQPAQKLLSDVSLSQPVCQRAEHHSSFSINQPCFDEVILQSVLYHIDSLNVGFSTGSNVNKLTALRDNHELSETQEVQKKIWAKHDCGHI